MKAAEKLELFRTVGDTDPFLVRLLVKTDAHPEGEPVSDDATVTMRLALDPVVELGGNARGDGLGYFSFDTTPIAGESQVAIPFDVVVDNGTISTQARGTVLNSKAVA